MNTCQSVYAYRMHGDTSDSEVQCTLKVGHEGNHHGVIKKNNIEIGINWVDSEGKKNFVGFSHIEECLKDIVERVTSDDNDPTSTIKWVITTWLQLERQKKENIWRNETVSPSREATQIRAKIMEIDELLEEANQL